jgi:hypothetical protein
VKLKIFLIAVPTGDRSLFRNAAGLSIFSRTFRYLFDCLKGSWSARLGSG